MNNQNNTAMKTTNTKNDTTMKNNNETTMKNNNSNNTTTMENNNSKNNTTMKNKNWKMAFYKPSNEATEFVRAALNRIGYSRERIDRVTMLCAMMQLARYTDKVKEIVKDDNEINIEEIPFYEEIKNIIENLENPISGEIPMFAERVSFVFFDKEAPAVERDYSKIYGPIAELFDEARFVVCGHKRKERISDEFAYELASAVVEILDTRWTKFNLPGIKMLPRGVAEVAVELCGEHKRYDVFTEGANMFGAVLQRGTYRYCGTGSSPDGMYDTKCRTFYLAKWLLNLLCSSKEEVLQQWEDKKKGWEYIQSVSERVEVEGEEAEEEREVERREAVLTYLNSSLVFDSNVITFGEILQGVDKGGCVVSAMPTSELIAPDDNIKEKMVATQWEVLSRNNVLDIVISLPGRLLGTSVEELSIVRLRKNRRKDEKVTFVDAREMYKEEDGRRVLDTDAVMEALQTETSGHRVSVRPEEVLAKGHNLTAEHFVTGRDVMRPANGDEVRRLGHFRKISEFGFEQCYLTKGRIGKVVHSSDLSNGLSDRGIDVSGLSEEVVTGLMELKEEAIMMSLVGEMRPTLCRATAEEPVCFGKGMAAIIVDEEVIDPTYLVMKLREVNPADWRVGGVVKIEDLFKMLVAYPRSRDEQRRIAEAAIAASDKAQVEVEKQGRLIKNIEESIAMELRMRKHDMKPYLMSIGDAARLMLKYIEKGLSTEDFPRILRGQLESIRELDDRINRLTDDLHEHGEEKRFDIVECLKGVASAEGKKKYETRLETHGIDEAAILVNPEEMKAVVDNIVGNAERHGFTDASRTDYELRIEVRFSEDGGSYIVDFTDNGNPLPEGMTKERYGLYGEKAGATGNTGLGGYRVAEVMRRCGGEYDIFNTEGGVTVRLTIPVA
ncbi:MAG: hypothetical protein II951_06540 [Bacteroidales bacterium]|nr:hypothetical protein [Bacteroidales bacterium]